jgi:hypothetical protein
MLLCQQGFMQVSWGRGKGLCVYLASPIDHLASKFELGVNQYVLYSHYKFPIPSVTNLSLIGETAIATCTAWTQKLGETTSKTFWLFNPLEFTFKSRLKKQHKPLFWKHFSVSATIDCARPTLWHARTPTR